jgi:hypothetical protein
MLEGIDVETDGQRSEEGRHLRAVDHDALDPACAVGDHGTTAEIAVRNRLLEQRAQQVVDVGGARDKAAIHEELRRRLERHVPPHTDAAHLAPAPSGARFGEW